MKTKLITYFERQESYIFQADSIIERVSLLHNCFGALDFAMSLLDDTDAEAELIELWESEWRSRLEAKVYG